MAPWQLVAFVAGFLGLVMALVGPLDALGEALFSAHMIQHLVLMNVAAPLLVLAAPLQVMVRPLPRRVQRALAAGVAANASWRAAWSWLSGLAAATLLQQAVLWGWHTPRAVAAALASDPVHIAMHASLLAAGLLFWTALLRPRQNGYWGGVLALVVTLKITGLLSIVLLLSPNALYQAYGDSAAAWGLTPLEDEQLGWGIMMTVGTLTYLGGAVMLFAVSFAKLQALPLRGQKRLIASEIGAAHESRQGHLP